MWFNSEVQRGYLNIFASSEALSNKLLIFLCKCRLSPCEWSQPQSEQNRFSLLHSLWYTAGALTLQGKHLTHVCMTQSGSFLILLFLSVLNCTYFLWSSGAGPHPRALSGRVTCCTWWLFSVVLLACYFSNLNSARSSESTHLTVKGFEDLANQDMIEYGCLAGSSTLGFFKVNMRILISQLLKH